MGCAQPQRVAVLRRFIEDIALGADVADERHDHLFADGIDGRIGDLREQLLEVIEQRLRLVGKAGERRIRAHGADRLLPRFGHGGQDHLEVFVGVAEGALAREQRFVIGMPCSREGSAQLIEGDLVFGEPLRVGAGGE